MQRHLGARRPLALGTGGSAAWVAGAGWVPLLLLAAAQSRFGAAGGLDAFLADHGLHARALLAAPALALGRTISYPQLSQTCAHFTKAGLISALDRPRFDATLASTRRLEASPVAALGALLLAYSLVAAVVASGPALPAWHAGSGAGWLERYSPAGWWHVLVSLPMLLMLIFGWFWRLLLWARLLWIVSRFNLLLVPAHPDRAAGLKFVGYAVRSFAPAGFALGVIVAGTLANRMSRQDVSFATFRDTAAGLLLVVLLTFGTPPIVFIRSLSSAWQRGIHQYGSFAHGLGLEFERKWLRGTKPDAPMLGLQDFSALNDLYQCVSNVYSMRVLPLDARSLLALGVATSAPIALVAVWNLPLEVLGKFIVELMF